MVLDPHSLIPDSLQRTLARRRVIKVFRKRLGYELNLDAPSSYCEKLQWLKLFYLEHRPDVIRCTDKYEVRAYLEERGFGAILPRLYGAWDSANLIEWEKLPSRFALKLNNGSGEQYCWLVKDAAALDMDECVRQIEAVRRKRYGYHDGEFHYAKIEPKIIAEEYLGDDITDYKFYCFNGRVGFMSAETGRFRGEHVRGYYSLKFETSPIEFYDDLPAPKAPLARPKKLEEMLDVAKRLSRGHPHVRVDLYNIHGEIFFGELTFSPECGYTKWKPRSLDFQYGELVDLQLAKDFLASRSHP